MMLRIDHCPRCGKRKVRPDNISRGEYQYTCNCQKCEILPDGTMVAGWVMMWSVPVRAKADVMFLIDETVSWMLWSDADNVQAYVIKEAIKNGQITVDEMVDHFRRELERGLE